MNFMRKKAAFDRYSPLLKDGKTLDQVKEAVEKDKLEFSEDEIVEIMTAIQDGDLKNEQKDTEQQPASAAEKTEQSPLSAGSETKDTDLPKQRRGELKTYQLFKVKEVKDTVVIAGKKQTYLKGFEKAGEMIRETSISEKHAETLNSQVVNTREYYFLPGDNEMIKAEKFF